VALQPLFAFVRPVSALSLKSSGTLTPSASCLSKPVLHRSGELWHAFPLDQSFSSPPPPPPPPPPP